ncbi:hypothetical protein [Streptomyces sp. NBC_00470]|uniref:hypothetical protein n=1 Tax=Streptomyces sp. NBC_00470 TaxID=2975753 RepID=UPI0030E5EC0E
MNITLTLDGVLRTPTGTPNRIGRDLFHALERDNTLYVLTTDHNADARRWLQLNQFYGWAQLLTIPHTENGRSPDAQRAHRNDRHIEFIQSIRHELHLDLAIEADPDIAAGLLRHGLPTVLTTHPAFSHPLHRPDHDRTPTPWDNLKKAIEEDRLTTAPNSEDD